MRKISKKILGILNDGTPAYLFTIRNDQQTEIEITNFGATVVSVKVPDKIGNLADVVLGYDTLDGYLQDKAYLGAAVGRYANRIAAGRFVLDGKTYLLARNDGENHLHGGIKGFNKVFWKAEEMIIDSNPAVKLSYLSRDGEEGYPGNLTTTIMYTLTPDNALKIDYSATTDKKTVLNLTNHSYFNLAGIESGNILDHILMIHADRTTKIKKGLIPTGEYKDVTASPFDFRKPTMIGERIDDEDPQLQLGFGYDHNWVLNEWDGSLRLAATVFHPLSGRYLEVFTTEPGMQFYTGNFLDGTITGKNRRKYGYRSALCLEAQHFANSPNLPDFPSVTLKPGDIYTQTTIYRFSVKQ